MSAPLDAHHKPDRPKNFSLTEPYVFANGDTFRGEKDERTGEANGWGRYVFSAPPGNHESDNLHAVFEGQWRNDLPNGQGSFTYPSSGGARNYYTGGVINGRRDTGESDSTMYLGTGNQYKCAYKYDQRVGPGKLIVSQWKNVETCVLRVSMSAK